MDIQWLKQLVELLEASSLTALELEEDGRRVRLERAAKGGAGVPASLVQNSGAPVEPQTRSTEHKALEEQDWSNYKGIHSPMVGTFRTLGALGKGEDIASGAKVRKGQVVCFIEAMKLMNEITAEEDCEIAQALVKDGEMVEFGQLMFRYQ